MKTLLTRRGEIRFPAYVPVTTFGDRYPLDSLIRPYLPRLAPAVMVSYHYARQMDAPPRIPLWVDSGGYVSLGRNAVIRKRGDLGVVTIRQEDGAEEVHPRDVLDLQERVADVAFTLDFPIAPGTSMREARRRLRLTVANAGWALQNRRRKDLPLFACVQGWDVDSFRECARAYVDLPFDGVAIGGLVPRTRDRELVVAIVRAVREIVGEKPLHVFGLGKPDLVKVLYDAGADSVDSSAYVKLAADGRLWSDPDIALADPSPTDRLHIALCNLAFATGKTLPLSMSNLLLTTSSLVRHCRGHS